MSNNQRLNVYEPPPNWSRLPEDQRILLMRGFDAGWSAREELERNLARGKDDVLAGKATELHWPIRDGSHGRPLG